jgi:hypothetical protein
MPLQTTEMPAITSVMAQRSPADLIAILLDSTEGINCDLQEIKKPARQWRPSNRARSKRRVGSCPAAQPALWNGAYKRRPAWHLVIARQLFDFLRHGVCPQRQAQSAELAVLDML